MDFKPINFRDKLGRITEHWSPRIIAQLNNYHFKLVKLQGEFVWHKHDDTDEAFIVLEGEMRIAFRNGEVGLHAGEMFVVPNGMEHKPLAAMECSVLLVEPTGTVNTGDASSKFTVENDLWI
jgi:mannose-6-phosphate isomerase-like protein (cupin superfamily)